MKISPKKADRHQGQISLFFSRIAGAELCVSDYLALVMSDTAVYRASTLQPLHVKTLGIAGLLTSTLSPIGNSPATPRVCIYWMCFEVFASTFYNMSQVFFYKYIYTSLFLFLQNQCVYFSGPYDGLHWGSLLF